MSVQVFVSRYRISALFASAKRAVREGLAPASRRMPSAKGAAAGGFREGGQFAGGRFEGRGRRLALRGAAPAGGGRGRRNRARRRRTAAAPPAGWRPAPGGRRTDPCESLSRPPPSSGRPPRRPPRARGGGRRGSGRVRRRGGGGSRQGRPLGVEAGQAAKPRPGELTGGGGAVGASCYPAPPGVRRRPGASPRGGISPRPGQAIARRHPVGGEHAPRFARSPLPGGQHLCLRNKKRAWRETDTLCPLGQYLDPMEYTAPPAWVL